MVFRKRNVHQGIVLIRLGLMVSVEKARLVNYVLSEYREKLINVFTVIQPNAIRIRKQDISL
jgi:hypothetical protein